VWRELHSLKLIRPVSPGNSRGSPSYYLVGDIEEALMRLRDSHPINEEVCDAD